MNAWLPARSIGTRLFSLLGLGLIAPMLVIVWAGTKVSDELDERSRTRGLVIASAAAERINTRVLTGLEVLNAVATREPWVQKPGLDDALRRAQLRQHELFDAVFAFDAEGRLVAGDLGPALVSGPTVVAEAKRLGRTGIAGPPTFVPSALALVPLTGRDGTLQLVVGARFKVDAHRRARLSHALGLEEGEQVVMVDGLGRTIDGAAPPFELLEGGDEALRSALTTARVPVAGRCSSCGQEGISWAAAPVSAARWTVMVWQPLPRARAFHRTLVVQIVGLTGVLFALAALFAWGASASVTGPLSTLTGAARRIAGGDLDATIGPLPPDEVGVLGEALEQMRVSVREARSRVVQLNAELEARVEERTRKLAAREAERTVLLRRVISAQEDERKRLARELHDETSQALAALSMGLDAAASTAQEPTKTSLAHLRTVASSALAEVHRFILDLRPSVLDDLGLPSAIEWCADRTLRSKGVTVRCEFSGLEQRLSWELETAIFRAVQEALNNVARHSGAETVLVQLQVRDGRISLEIEDDGRGFDPVSMETPRPNGQGLGLLGMRERVESFGGALFIDSAPGHGTQVKVEIEVPGHG